jgi:hypothetical protein
MQARSRAQLERVPNGIRLLPTTVADYPPNTLTAGSISYPPYTTRIAWSEQIEYVHDPGDFAEIGSFCTEIAPTANAQIVQVVGVSRPIMNDVAAGDVIEFLGNGQMFGIVAVSANNQLQLFRARSFPLITASPPTQPNYRIIRKPRPVPGERPLEMPRGVVIDVTLSWYATNPPFPPPGPFPPAPAMDRDLGNTLWMRGISTPGIVDIMFGPSGQVVGDAAVNDIVYLWLHPRGEVNNWLLQNPNVALGEAANQSLVVVYSRNGTTSSFPVNQGTQGAPGDPYLFAKSARAQSVGGL